MLSAVLMVVLLASGPAVAADKQPLLSKLDGLGGFRYGTSIDVVLVGFEPHEQGTSLGARARATGKHWPGETPGGWGAPSGEDPDSKQLAEWLVEGLRFDGSSLAAMLQELSHPVTMRPQGRPEWQAAAASEAASAAWSHPSDDTQGSDPEEDTALEAARVQGGGRAKRAAAAAGGGEHIDALADAAAAVSAPTAGSPAAAAVDMPVALSITPNYRVTHARRSLWRAVQDVVERQLAAAREQRLAPGGSGSGSGSGSGVPVLDPEALVSLLRAHHEAMGHGTSLFVLHPRIIQAARGGSQGHGGFVSLPVEAPAGGGNGGGGTFESARRRDDLAARLERAAGQGPGPVVASAARYAYQCPTRGCSCNAGVDWSRRLAWIDVGAHGADAVATHRHAGEQEMRKVFSAELRRMHAMTSGGDAPEPTPDGEAQSLARSWAAPRFPIVASAVLASTGKLTGNAGLTALSGGRAGDLGPVARGDASRLLAAWAGRMGSWLARLTEAVVASPVYAIPQGTVPEGASTPGAAVLAASHEARVRVLILRVDEAQLRAAGSAGTGGPGAGREGGATARVRWGPCATTEGAAQRPGLDAALAPLLDASRHASGRAAEGLPEEVGLAATHVTAECAVVPLEACTNCAEVLRRAAAAPPSEGAPVLLSGEAMAQWLQEESLRVRGDGGADSTLDIRSVKGSTTRAVPAVLLSVRPDPARHGRPGASGPAALLWDGPFAFASATAGVAVAVRTEPATAAPAVPEAETRVCDGSLACGGRAQRLDPAADVARALVAATLESGWGVRSSAAPAAACAGVPALGASAQGNAFDVGPWDAARVRSHHRECWTTSSRSVTVDTESRLVPLEPSLEVLLAAERADGQLPFHLVDALGRAEFLLSAQRALQPARLAVLAAAAHSRGGSSLAHGLGVPAAEAERISDQMLGVEARLAEAEAELVQLHPHAARLGMELALAPASRALAQSIAVAVSRRHRQLAQDAPGCAPQARVLVGLYVLAITSVEQAKGQFGIDAYLYLRSSQGTYSGSCPPVEGSVCPAQDSIGRILVNSKDVAVTTINKFASDANTTTQFRIKGTLTASFQYQAWPFESTQLEVAIEDPIRSNSSLKLMPLDSFTSLSPTVAAPGWNLHAAENRTTIVTRASDVLYRREDASASFSRVSFFILLSRPALSAFLKYLLPPTLILVMQVFAMLITPDSVATRVSMAGSGLVTAVLFHTQLTAQTPPANYLVFSDRFMLATYFVIVINGVGSVLVIKAKSRGLRAGSRREAAGWQAHAQSEAVMTASLLAAAMAVLAAWLGDYDMGLQVALGATPPLLTLAAVSSAGALCSHWMCGCHCVTPAEVLLARQRVADRKLARQGPSSAMAAHSSGVLQSPTDRAMSGKGKSKSAPETPIEEPAVASDATGAARNGMLGVLKRLVAESPETAAITKDEMGMSPLAWASRNGHLEIVKFLAENGADLDAACAGGLRPVHLACLKGHDEVVRALIAAGCDVAAATEAGDHAIHFASRAGNTNMCSDLIEAGADLEASSLAGTTPLACAANAGHEGCVRFLLKRGASATVLDGHSCSPLHLAAAGGHLHVVQLLLANGCDGLQLNSHGQSPLDLAVGKETKAALSGGAAAASS
ncbi:hypothetical protein FNF27_05945 [Cafeteria roenbergensis]|uniref:Uncharacterized protein n=1 Tax=Cafeteria roenbergensis TaxID=33653 RepID=A0A5A8E9N9_CAFRO|nr:hypothetical protein FNF27_05945 [Cafeteria roenbergensis]